MQQLQPLLCNLDADHGDACDVAARPVKAGDKPRRHWIVRDRENDRNGFGRRHRRLDRDDAAACEDDFDFAADEIGRHTVQLIELTIRPAIFDRRRCDPRQNQFHQDCGGMRPCWPPKALLLTRRKATRSPASPTAGPRRERPRHRRATEQRDEVAPSHAEHEAPPRVPPPTIPARDRHWRSRFAALPACPGQVSRSLGQT